MKNGIAKITMLLFVLSLARPVSAQWKIGAQAGVDFNTLETSSSFAYDRHYDERAGFSVGIPVRYEFKNWFALQGEVNFMQKNYGMHRSGAYKKNQYKYTNNFLDIPVFARFSFGGEKLRGYLLGGAYIGAWLSGHAKGSLPLYYFTTTDEDADTPYYDFSGKAPFDSRRDNRFDGGLATGVGLQWQVSPLIELFAEGRYYYGLSDLQKDYMSRKQPRYNTTLALQLGIMFTLSK